MILKIAYKGSGGEKKQRLFLQCCITMTAELVINWNRRFIIKWENKKMWPYKFSVFSQHLCGYNLTYVPVRIDQKGYLLIKDFVKEFRIKDLKTTTKTMENN